MSTQTNTKLDNKLYFKTYNLLKTLGLKSSLIGTKLIIKSTLIILNQESDCVVFEDVYSVISKTTKISTVQIRNSIKYAIDNRNIALSESNFENVFGYEYDEYLFTNKELIEELVRVIICEQ